MSHWEDLEDEIVDTIGFNSKKTRGSGNKKGDCDVTTQISNLPKILFEGKSQEYPKGNVIVKQDEWDKMQRQVKAFFGIGIYVRRNKLGELVACLKLQDLKTILEKVSHQS